MAGNARRISFSGPFSLQGEFPAPTLDEWRDLAHRSLRGKSLDSLVVEISDGIATNPLYTADDDHPSPGVPGEPPFTRGAFASNGPANDWIQSPLYDQPDFDRIAFRAADDSAVWFRLARAIRRGLPPDSIDNDSPTVDGVIMWTAADAEPLFQAAERRSVPFILDGGGSGLAMAALFTAAARRSGVDLSGATGAFGIDPLAALAGDGEILLGDEQTFSMMADLGSWCLNNAPGIRAVSVSTIPYHMAGATAVYETALAVATGVEYLRTFERSGIDPALASRQLLFRFAIGRDLFTEVARLRAFRRLWACVAAECGFADDAALPVVHAVTSPRTLTTRDPWVNMLRTTVGAFAAAVGGADFITTLPFDAAIGPPNELGRRMAINTHRVLREECHLGHVLDPGGGSWYIETLTDELAHAAWRDFKAVERHGGMRRALAERVVASAIAASAKKSRHATATRRSPITGVSTWPNLREEQPDPAAPDIESIVRRVVSRGAPLPADHPALNALAELAGAAREGAPRGSVFEVAVDAAEAGATLGQLNRHLLGGSSPSAMTALPCFRLAEPFEDLREASDQSLASTGRRPRAFLANLGTVADFTARTTFAKNALEAGGIETVDSGGFESVEAAAAAFGKSGCTAVCLCSSDEIYAALAADLEPALRDRGAQVVLLAGRPGAGPAGVDHHLYLGCDVLETLGAVLSALEAAS